ncbi:MAG: hypothetical protein JSR66_14750 [Proteobacteria bacterium]|nr:hypothetical protein [Pseudomonadota bacterium]
MKNSSTLSVLAALCGLSPGFALAALSSPGLPVNVVQSYAYATYGGGDFVFSTSQQSAGCESGWYLKATDPGYKAVVATVLSAQAAGLQVTVTGDPNDLWPGSPSGHFCRVQYVGTAS